jgi:hypothetical protein
MMRANHGRVPESRHGFVESLQRRDGSMSEATDEKARRAIAGCLSCLEVHQRGRRKGGRDGSHHEGSKRSAARQCTGRWDHRRLALPMQGLSRCNAGRSRRPRVRARNKLPSQP